MSQFDVPSLGRRWRIRNAFTNPQIALVEAGQNRPRPIAMTTIAAILALLPVRVGPGLGDAAAACACDRDHPRLIVQLPLVLLLLHVLVQILMKQRSGQNVT